VAKSETSTDDLGELASNETSKSKILREIAQGIIKPEYDLNKLLASAVRFDFEKAAAILIEHGAEITEDIVIAAEIYNCYAVKQKLNRLLLDAIKGQKFSEAQELINKGADLASDSVLEGIKFYNPIPPMLQQLLNDEIVKIFSKDYKEKRYTQLQHIHLGAKLAKTTQFLYTSSLQEMYEKLKAAGAKPFVSDQTGKTASFILDQGLGDYYFLDALQSNNIRVIKLFLESNINILQGKTSTELLSLVTNDTVRSLLLVELDKHLIAAASEGNIEKVKKLIHEQNNPNSLKLALDITNDPAIKTHLQTSLDQRLLKIISQTTILTNINNINLIINEIITLIECSADVNVKDSYGKTPLHFAVKQKNKGLVQWLIEKGADPNTNIALGGTILHWAIQQNNKELIQLLLEKGADPNTKLDMGITILHWAVRCDNKELVQLLLEKGANVHATDIMGETSLQWAVNKSSKELAYLLVKNGANPNTKIASCNTILHWAVQQNNQELVQLLIENGADIKVKNKQGDTPLHLAVKGSKKELAQLLLERGADVNVTDNERNTPLHWAISKGNKELAQVLLDHGAKYDFASYKLCRDKEMKSILFFKMIKGFVLPKVISYGASIGIFTIAARFIGAIAQTAYSVLGAFLDMKKMGYQPENFGSTTLGVASTIVLVAALAITVGKATSYYITNHLHARKIMQTAKKVATPNVGKA